MRNLQLAIVWRLLCSIAVISNAVSSDNGIRIPYLVASNTPWWSGSNHHTGEIEIPELTCISADQTIFNIMQESKDNCRGKDYKVTFYYQHGDDYTNLGSTVINKYLFHNILIKYHGWSLSSEKIDTTNGKDTPKYNEDNQFDDSTKENLNYNEVWLNANISPKYKEEPQHTEDICDYFHHDDYNIDNKEHNHLDFQEDNDVNDNQNNVKHGHVNPKHQSQFKFKPFDISLPDHIHTSSMPTIINVYIDTDNQNKKTVKIMENNKIKEHKNNGLHLINVDEQNLRLGDDVSNLRISDVVDLLFNYIENNKFDLSSPLIFNLHPSHELEKNPSLMIYDTHTAKNAVEYMNNVDTDSLVSDIDSNLFKDQANLEEKSLLSYVASTDNSYEHKDRNLIDSTSDSFEKTYDSEEKYTYDSPKTVNSKSITRDDLNTYINISQDKEPLNGIDYVINTDNELLFVDTKNPIYTSFSPLNVSPIEKLQLHKHSDPSISPFIEFEGQTPKYFVQKHPSDTHISEVCYKYGTEPPINSNIQGDYIPINNAMSDETPSIETMISNRNPLIWDSGDHPEIVSSDLDPCLYSATSPVTLQEPTYAAPSFKISANIKPSKEDVTPIVSSKNVFPNTFAKPHPGVEIITSQFASAPYGESSIQPVIMAQPKPAMVEELLPYTISESIQPMTIPNCQIAEKALPSSIPNIFRYANPLLSPKSMTVEATSIPKAIPVLQPHIIPQQSEATKIQPLTNFDTVIPAFSSINMYPKTQSHRAFPMMSSTTNNKEPFMIYPLPVNTNNHLQISPSWPSVPIKMSESDPRYYLPETLTEPVTSPAYAAVPVETFLFKTPQAAKMETFNELMPRITSARDYYPPVLQTTIPQLGPLRDLSKNLKNNSTPFDSPKLWPNTELVASLASKYVPIAQEVIPVTSKSPKPVYANPTSNNFVTSLMPLIFSPQIARKVPLTNMAKTLTGLNQPLFPINLLQPKDTTPTITRNLLRPFTETPTALLDTSSPKSYSSREEIYPAVPFVSPKPKLSDSYKIQSLERVNQIYDPNATAAEDLKMASPVNEFKLELTNFPVSRTADYTTQNYEVYSTPCNTYLPLDKKNSKPILTYTEPLVNNLVSQKSPPTSLLYSEEIAQEIPSPVQKYIELGKSGSTSSPELKENKVSTTPLPCTVNSILASNLLKIGQPTPYDKLVQPKPGPVLPVPYTSFPFYNVDVSHKPSLSFQKYEFQPKPPNNIPMSPAAIFTTPLTEKISPLSVYSVTSDKLSSISDTEPYMTLHKMSSVKIIPISQTPILINPLVANTLKSYPTPYNVNPLCNTEICEANFETFLPLSPVMNTIASSATVPNSPTYSKGPALVTPLSYPNPCIKQNIPSISPHEIIKSPLAAPGTPLWPIQMYDTLNNNLDMKRVPDISPQPIKTVPSSSILPTAAFTSPRLLRPIPQLKEPVLEYNPLTLETTPISSISPLLTNKLPSTSTILRYIPEPKRLSIESTPIPDISPLQIKETSSASPVPYSTTPTYTYPRLLRPKPHLKYPVLNPIPSEHNSITSESTPIPIITPLQIEKPPLASTIPYASTPTYTYPRSLKPIPQLKYPVLNPILSVNNPIITESTPIPFISPLQIEKPPFVSAIPFASTAAYTYPRLLRPKPQLKYPVLNSMLSEYSPANISPLQIKEPPSASTMPYASTATYTCPRLLRPIPQPKKLVLNPMPTEYNPIKIEPPSVPTINPLQIEEHQPPTAYSIPYVPTSIYTYSRLYRPIPESKTVAWDSISSNIKPITIESTPMPSISPLQIQEPLSASTMPYASTPTYADSRLLKPIPQLKYPVFNPILSMTESTPIPFISPLQIEKPPFSSTIPYESTAAYTYPTLLRPIPQLKYPLLNPIISESSPLTTKSTLIPIVPLRIKEIPPASTIPYVSSPIPSISPLQVKEPLSVSTIPDAATPTYTYPRLLTPQLIYSALNPILSEYNPTTTASTLQPCIKPLQIREPPSALTYASTATYTCPRLLRPIPQPIKPVLNPMPSEYNPIRIESTPVSTISPLQIKEDQPSTVSSIPDVPTSIYTHPRLLRPLSESKRVAWDSISSNINPITIESTPMPSISPLQPITQLQNPELNPILSEHNPITTESTPIPTISPLQIEEPPFASTIPYASPAAYTYPRSLSPIPQRKYPVLNPILSEHSPITTESTPIHSISPLQIEIPPFVSSLPYASIAAYKYPVKHRPITQVQNPELNPILSEYSPLKTKSTSIPSISPLQIKEPPFASPIPYTSTATDTYPRLLRPVSQLKYSVLNPILSEHNPITTESTPIPSIIPLQIEEPPFASTIPYASIAAYTYPVKHIPIPQFKYPVLNPILSEHSPITSESTPIPNISSLLIKETPFESTISYASTPSYTYPRLLRPSSESKEQTWDSKSPIKLPESIKEVSLSPESRGQFVTPLKYKEIVKSSPFSVTGTPHSSIQQVFTPAPNKITNTVACNYLPLANPFREPMTEVSPSPESRGQFATPLKYEEIVKTSPVSITGAPYSSLQALFTPAPNEVTNAVPCNHLPLANPLREPMTEVSSSPESSGQFVTPLKYKEIVKSSPISVTSAPHSIQPLFTPVHNKITNTVPCNYLPLENPLRNPITEVSSSPESRGQLVTPLKYPEIIKSSPVSVMGVPESSIQPLFTPAPNKITNTVAGNYLPLANPLREPMTEVSSSPESRGQFATPLKYEEIVKSSPVSITGAPHSSLQALFTPAFKKTTKAVPCNYIPLENPLREPMTEVSSSPESRSQFVTPLKYEEIVKSSPISVTGAPHSIQPLFAPVHNKITNTVPCDYLPLANPLQEPITEVSSSTESRGQFVTPLKYKEIVKSLPTSVTGVPHSSIQPLFTKITNTVPCNYVMSNPINKNLQTEVPLPPESMVKSVNLSKYEPLLKTTLKSQSGVPHTSIQSLFTPMPSKIASQNSLGLRPAQYIPLTPALLLSNSIRNPLKHTTPYHLPYSELTSNPVISIPALYKSTEYTPGFPLPPISPKDYDNTSVSSAGSPLLYETSFQGLPSSIPVKPPKTQQTSPSWETAREIKSLTTNPSFNSKFMTTLSSPISSAPAIISPLQSPDLNTSPILLPKSSISTLLESKVQNDLPTVNILYMKPILSSSTYLNSPVISNIPTAIPLQTLNNYTPWIPISTKIIHDQFSVPDLATLKSVPLVGKYILPTLSIGKQAEPTVKFAELNPLSMISNYLPTTDLKVKPLLSSPLEKHNSVSPILFSPFQPSDHFNTALNIPVSTTSLSNLTPLQSLSPNDYSDYERTTLTPLLGTSPETISQFLPIDVPRFISTTSVNPSLNNIVSISNLQLTPLESSEYMATKSAAYNTLTPSSNSPIMPSYTSKISNKLPTLNDPFRVNPYNNLIINPTIVMSPTTNNQFTPLMPTEYKSIQPLIITPLNNGISPVSKSTSIPLQGATLQPKNVDIAASDIRQISQSSVTPLALSSFVPQKIPTNPLNYVNTPANYLTNAGPFPVSYTSPQLLNTAKEIGPDASISYTDFIQPHKMKIPSNGIIFPSPSLPIRSNQISQSLPTTSVNTIAASPLSVLSAVSTRNPNELPSICSLNNIGNKILSDNPKPCSVNNIYSSLNNINDKIPLSSYTNLYSRPKTIVPKWEEIPLRSISPETLIDSKYIDESTFSTYYRPIDCNYVTTAPCTSNLAPQQNQMVNKNSNYLMTDILENPKVNVNLENAIKPKLQDYINKNEKVQSDLYNRNGDLSIPLGNIVIAKKDSTNPNIHSMNPSIGYKSWCSNLKLVEAKLCLKFKDISVNNFQPVVKYSNVYNLNEIENLFKNYIESKYGAVIVVNNNYSLNSHYEVLRNCSNICDNRCNLLWPTDTSGQWGKTPV